MKARLAVAALLALLVAAVFTTSAPAGWRYAEFAALLAVALFLVALTVRGASQALRLERLEQADRAAVAAASLRLGEYRDDEPLEPFKFFYDRDGGGVR